MRPSDDHVDLVGAGFHRTPDFIDAIGQGR